MSTSAAQQPSPQLFFQTINAHQRTEALKAGIELEVFTAIGEGNTTAAAIAKRCQTSERGMRILCDYLTIMEMLTKQGDRYGLTLDSATFLDKRSPAYLGTATDFLCSPEMFQNTKTMADAVRKGGTVLEDEGTVSTENPVWVKFARGMAPLMAMPAQLMAKLVDPQRREARLPFGVVAIAQHTFDQVHGDQNLPDCGGRRGCSATTSREPSHRRRASVDDAS